LRSGSFERVGDVFDLRGAQKKDRSLIREASPIHLVDRGRPHGENIHPFGTSNPCFKIPDKVISKIAAIRALVTILFPDNNM
jgi:hypothetical protein